jgi:hypothetical protein
MKNLLFLLIVFSFGWAQATDSNAEVIQNTQNFLSDSSQRQQALNASPAVAQVDRNVGNIFQGQQDKKQELYDISAAIIPWLAQQSNGDPKKMMELMAEAQKNPKAFYERLPSAEKARIKSLADSVEASNNRNNQKP